MKKIVISLLLALTPFTAVKAEPYVGVSLGWTFNQKLSGIKGDENLNYPGPMQPNDITYYPGSSYSDINLKDALTGGLKAGYYFESNPSFGFEVEANYSQPNMKRQNVTISNSTANTASGAYIGQAVSADIATNVAPAGWSGNANQVTEDQLGANVKVLQFNLNAMYRYQGIKNFTPYVGIGPSLNIVKITGTGESGHFVDPVDPTGYEVTNNAPRVHDTSVNIGANFKIGAEYKLDEQWGVGGEYRYTWVPVDISQFRSANNLSADLELQSLSLVLTRHF